MIKQQLLSIWWGACNAKLPKHIVRKRALYLLVSHVKKSVRNIVRILKS